MTWLLLAFASAALLGCYDTLKKVALKDNAVIPVNTLFSSLIFLPLIFLSGATNVLDDSIFHVGSGGWEMHKYIVLKAILVLSSWILGYFAMKNLPLTIVGPINATRPVMVLVGALLVFGERLNGWQWAGVLMAILSYFLLRKSGKKEGIDRCCGVRSSQRTVRQIPDGSGRPGRGRARPHDGAVVVHDIPMWHHGCFGGSDVVA